MLNEVGPDFLLASKHHESVLHRYIEHTENSWNFMFINLLYPQYVPRRRLTPVVEQLGTVRDNNSSAAAIREAGWQALALSQDLRTFSGNSMNKEGSGRILSPQALSVINEAIDRYCETVQALESMYANDDCKERTKELKEIAKTACLTSRTASLLLFSGWREYIAGEGTEGVKRFIAELKMGKSYALLLAEKLKDSDIAKYVTSIQARLAIVTALLDNNDDGVRQLLDEQERLGRMRVQM